MLLRLVLGFTFMYHGYLKLFVSGNLPSLASNFSKMGIPLANVSAVAVAVTEFAGGMLLIMGFLTRFASLALIFEMLVAFFKVHLKNGFLITSKSYGYEFILLILVCLFVVLLNGPGMLSLGKMFKGKSLV